MLAVFLLVLRREMASLFNDNKAYKQMLGFKKTLLFHYFGFFHVYLMMHSIHFINVLYDGHMIKNHSDNDIEN